MYIFNVYFYEFNSTIKIELNTNLIILKINHQVLYGKRKIKYIRKY